MKDFWENRYGKKEWAYGREPNRYFKDQLNTLPEGGILLPADGEGRNSVYAASCGWEVTAFDLSEAGRNKAIKLAAEKGVSIKYLTGNLADLDFPEASFDAMALIFAHFPSQFKTDFHKKLIKYLKYGGTLIFEAFSLEHLKYSAANPAAGGPKDPEMLYTTGEIEKLFPNIEILELIQMETTLDEGLYHQGLSSVVRFTGRKAV